jgi:hypothetical protein
MKGAAEAAPVVDAAAVGEAVAEAMAPHIAAALEESLADESPADAPLGKPVACHELGCGHGKCMPGDELPESCLGCFQPGRDFVIVEA